MCQHHSVMSAKLNIDRLLLLALKLVPIKQRDTCPPFCRSSPKEFAVHWYIHSLIHLVK